MTEYIERLEKLIKLSEKTEHTLSEKELCMIEKYKKYILDGFFTIR